MKSYLEMLKESKTKEMINAAERHLRNTATLLAMIYDELKDLNATERHMGNIASLLSMICGELNDLNDSVIYLEKVTK